MQAQEMLTDNAFLSVQKETQHVHIVIRLRPAASQMLIDSKTLDKELYENSTQTISVRKSAKALPDTHKSNPK
jgi:hypothetical protein